MRRTASRKEVRKNRKIDDKLTMVGGIVIPVDWDEEGNAIAAAISSPGEQEYLIEQDSKGKELLAFIRQEIQASGVVKKATKGRKTIRVKTYGLKKSSNCFTKA